MLSQSRPQAFQFCRRLAKQHNEKGAAGPLSALEKSGLAAGEEIQVIFLANDVCSYGLAIVSPRG
jgi:hypothetical protein